MLMQKHTQFATFVKNKLLIKRKKTVKILFVYKPFLILHILYKKNNANHLENQSAKNTDIAIIYQIY